MIDDEPITDLRVYEQRQAALYGALAQYQHAAAGEALVHPGSFGLAVYHQLEHHDGATFLRAVLAHSDGGSLDSGPAAINQTAGDLFPLSELLTRLVLGSALLPASAPQQTQQPAALPLQQPEPAPAEEPLAPEPEPACPMPAPAPAAEPAAPADDAPTEEEVEAALGALDALHGEKPDAVAAILRDYKAEHQIGRQPFVKSLTTRARLDTLTQLIATHA